MNKKFLSVIIASVLALSLFGCGAEEKPEEVPSVPEESPASSSEAKELSNEEILSKMVEVSELNKIQENCKTAAVETTSYTADGTAVFSRIYKDDEKVVLDYPDEDAFIENGKVYLINTETGHFSEYFYPGEAYELFVSPFENLSFGNFNLEAEEIDSCELNDGKYLLKSHEKSSEKAAEYASELGYSENIKSLRYEYTIASDTFELIENNIFILFNDGTEKPFATDVVKKDVEVISVPEDIHSKIFSEDKRTITFFEDAETSYTLEASKGVPVIIIPAYEGEYELYIDENFTEKLQQETNFDEDKTVYLKKL